MKNIYVIMKFESGKMLVAVDYGSIRVITPTQYFAFLKQYPQK